MQTNKALDKLAGFISNYSMVFWDFDGVIKDSVAVKTLAYESLFLPYGANVVTAVREHHEENGGMSRFEKIPIYLQKAGITATENVIEEFCYRFSDMVLERVIGSPWVPGALEYLTQAHANSNFILVTATPEDEIKIILERLGISSYFQNIFGAPVQKTAAIAGVIKKAGLKPGQALMIGDASADLVAAENNSIMFLLRQTLTNTLLQENYSGPQFRNFYDE
ncbi:HAD family hydrolase [Shewanella sp.]|uniref:HAD family hydrolase n=1 Tax=Shewanella sp. TaxID=50422 RepID=UPI004047C95E